MFQKNLNNFNLLISIFLRPNQHALNTSAAKCLNLETATILPNHAKKHATKKSLKTATIWAKDATILTPSKNFITFFSITFFEPKKKIKKKIFNEKDTT